MTLRQRFVGARPPRSRPTRHARLCVFPPSRRVRLRLLEAGWLRGALRSLLPAHADQTVREGRSVS